MDVSCPNEMVMSRGPVAGAQGPVATAAATATETIAGRTRIRRSTGRDVPRTHSAHRCPRCAAQPSTVSKARIGRLSILYRVLTRRDYFGHAPEDARCTASFLTPPAGIGGTRRARSIEHADLPPNQESAAEGRVVEGTEPGQHPATPKTHAVVMLPRSRGWWVEASARSRASDVLPTPAGPTGRSRHVRGKRSGSVVDGVGSSVSWRGVPS